MTEQEWLVSVNPGVMLSWLTAERGPAGYYVRHDRPISDRKLRLFACAISRRMVAAHGQADIATIEDACDNKAVDWDRWISPTAGPGCGYWCAEQDISHGLGELLHGDYATSAPAETVNLLRDIVGNPWRPVRVADDLDDFARLRQGLTRQHLTPTVLDLAQAAYQERADRECEPCQGVGHRHQVKTISGERAWMVCPTCYGAGRTKDGSLNPQRLLVLADALEENGAASEILSHLRSPGPHVRGCWCLDLLTGRS